jgi:ubiquinone/menaquinone biosynthesis C-methylase UbiE
MISDTISRVLHPRRIPDRHENTSEEIDAYVTSRALAYPSRLEDDFVTRALGLGVESGMILDVGTRVGLIALKMLWQNDDCYAIGVDESVAMVDRARETAKAWDLEERAFFQVGDCRRMRFKTAYFDIAVCDSVLHAFDDPIAVLAEIERVVKPKGAVLVRDLQRPTRLRMARRIEENVARYGQAMRPQIERSLQSAYSLRELRRIVKSSGLRGATVVESDGDHILIERRGQTDPNSWIKAREQYL